MSEPLEVFITYSHENTEAKDELITRLAVMKQQNELVTWHDNEMLPSDKWREEIFSTRLPNSDLLLYLVSAASLASENCNRELAVALEKNIKPIPIILEDCDWKKHQLGEFQALPDKGNPINEWEFKSKGWQNVVEGIRKFVDAMQSQVDSPPSTPEEELRAELAIQQGNFLLMLKQVDRAIETYSRAIDLNPRAAHAYYNRGNVYHNKGEFGRAITDYTKAIELNPNLAEAYNNRGNAYMDKGDSGSAIADYNKAIQLDTNCASAYYNRGVAYGEKGDTDRAIVDYTKAIELNPDYTEAYNNRGLAHSKTGNLNCAIADYDKAIQLRPNDAEAYNNRGLAHSKTGNLDCVIEDFTKVIQLRPNDAEAYNNRGVAYHRKGEINLAIKDYNRTMDLNPDFVAKVYCNRGEAWLHLREWGKAKSDLTAARDMGVDIITSFHNEYASVLDFEQKHDVQLPADLAAMLTPQGVAIGEEVEREAPHELASDFEIVLDEIVRKYDRAWKTLAKP